MQLVRMRTKARGLASVALEKLLCVSAESIEKMVS